MSQGLTLLVAMMAVVGLVAVLWRTHWAAVLVMAMYPVEQILQAYIPFFGGANRSLINIAVGLVAIIALLTAFFSRRQIFRGYVSPFSFALLALYLMTVVSVMWSYAPMIAKENVSEAIPYWVLLGVVFPLLVVDLRDIQRMLTGYLLLGTILAILLFLHPEASFYQGRLRLYMGVNAAGAQYSNALEIGTLGCYLALVAALLHPTRRTTAMLLLRLVAGMVGLGLAIASGSRGQVGAVLVSVAIFYPLSRRLANPRQFVLTALALLAMLGLAIVSFRFFVTGENAARWSAYGMQIGTGTRIEMARELLAAWASEPSRYLFGLGTSAFVNLSSFTTGYVHNVYVEALCEHGLFGFFLVLMMTWMAWVSGRRLWLMYRDEPVMRSTVAALCGLCCIAFLISLKQGSYIGAPVPFYLWFILVKTYRSEVAEIAAATGVVDYARLGQDQEPDLDALGGQEPLPV